MTDPRATTDHVSRADDDWRRFVEAARDGDQAMARIHLQAWAASASALIDRACDLLLERERPLAPPRQDAA